MKFISINYIQFAEIFKKSLKELVKPMKKTENNLVKAGLVKRYKKL